MFYNEKPKALHASQLQSSANYYQQANHYEEPFCKLNIYDILIGAITSATMVKKNLKANIYGTVGEIRKKTEFYIFKSL